MLPPHALPPLRFMMLCLPACKHLFLLCICTGAECVELIHCRRCFCRRPNDRLRCAHNSHKCQNKLSQPNKWFSASHMWPCCVHTIQQNNLSLCVCVHSVVLFRAAMVACRPTPSLGTGARAEKKQRSNEEEIKALTLTSSSPPPQPPLSASTTNKYNIQQCNVSAPRGIGSARCVRAFAHSDERKLIFFLLSSCCHCHCLLPFTHTGSDWTLAR